MYINLNKNNHEQCAQFHIKQTKSSLEHKMSKQKNSPVHVTTVHVIKAAVITSDMNPDRKYTETPPET